MSTLKNIPTPSWDLQIYNWLSHIPDTSRSLQEVDYLVKLFGQNLEDKIVTDPIPGLREKTFSDALFLREKALYCCRVRSSLNRAGQPTWTALAMYDACFFAAKSLCYLLGFRDIGADSKFYVSLFYIEQINRKKSRDAHLFLKLEKRMTHEMVWGILSRILRTTTGSSQAIANIKALNRWNFDKFTRERNALIYRSEIWSRPSTIDQSDLHCDISYLDNIAFEDTRGEHTAEYFDKYYRLAYRLLDIVEIFLSEIGHSAPAIKEYLVARPGLNSVKTMQAA